MIALINKGLSYLYGKKSYGLFDWHHILLGAIVLLIIYWIFKHIPKLLHPFRKIEVFLQQARIGLGKIFLIIFHPITADQPNIIFTVLEFSNFVEFLPDCLWSIFQDFLLQNETGYCIEWFLAEMGRLFR